jgi:hypothetical protein
MNEGRRNVVFGLAGAPIWIPATGYQELIASVSHLNGYRGFCLQQFDRLGDPDADSLLKEAKWAIEEALSQPNSAPLQRAFYVGDMAQLHARKGEVESACDRVRQIISIADAGVALRHKLLTARTLLEPYADVQAVKDLDAEIKVFQLQ